MLRTNHAGLSTHSKKQGTQFPLISLMQTGTVQHKTVADALCKTLAVAFQEKQQGHTGYSLRTAYFGQPFSDCEACLGGLGLAWLPKDFVAFRIAIGELVETLTAWQRYLDRITSTIQATANILCDGCSHRRIACLNTGIISATKVANNIFKHC